MRTIAVTAALVAAVSVATPLGAMPASAPGVRADASTYGRILFDDRGFVLYAFTADARGRSNCTRACARAWPPYLVKREPTAGPGSTRSLVGTTKRRDGTLQATYAGRPLYYYVGDRKPHQILCQNVSEYGGLWLVVRPTGKLVR
jgi:predicted lipoprotein with Yx(FWY)xxD motif